MDLSREDWEEMWPHVRAVMNGAEEAALRTSLTKIITTLADFPQAREEFANVLCDPLAITSVNSLRLFIAFAEKQAFKRAIERGTRLLKGGYAEWERLEDDNVSFSPQCLDPLGSNILINFCSSGAGVTRAVITINERKSRNP